MGQIERINAMIAEYKRKIEVLEGMKVVLEGGLRQPKWGNLQDMLKDLGAVPKHPAAPPPRPLTLQEIDDELDIIRGVKPTPPGYAVRPERMKELMQKRKELTTS